MHHTNVIGNDMITINVIYNVYKKWTGNRRFRAKTEIVEINEENCFLWDNW